MKVIEKSNCRSFAWLDSLAIGMSMLCAVHCLMTPVLIILLPIMATTFWVHQDFHLWMILFVVPTTSAAVFMGCRRHKDKAVLFLSILGLGFLVSVAGYETWFHVEHVLSEASTCPHCLAKQKGGISMGITIFNVIGGVFLASAHARNYLLCRASSCMHEN
ncbi:MAG: MerC domain-containing protein [Verrucomicrobia bacterium]|jgi:hypothetical protein|nr:MerC domain-containing protein [Verrucomicrobiota bacterium]MBT5063542.1 MerC domain-containing protein [Verrucomicrobiota bacterium]MBT5478424.1 MerC domain-containing protein [Verrucomicrobiota bacterium]MBT6237652.1 MerC domain-containing protein [Verrucomicrobiota bacterium]MBT7535243.1 MerC domain-containing protein [Verrucomicrobiota bacterium]